MTSIRYHFSAEGGAVRSEGKGPWHKLEKGQLDRDFAAIEMSDEYAPTRPVGIGPDDEVVYETELERRLREAEAENERLRAELVGREDEEYAVAPGLETTALYPKETQ